MERKRGSCQMEAGEMGRGWDGMDEDGMDGSKGGLNELQERKCGVGMQEC